MEKEDIMKKYFAPGKTTPRFPFDFIDSKITLLRKTMSLVNEHPEAVVPEKERLMELKATKTEAGSFLSFYVIQEIQDFYRQAKRLFKDRIKFPESAQGVKEFRDSSIAHINHEKASDIGTECLIMELTYGYDLILGEYEIFKRSIYRKLDSGELSLPKDKNSEE